MKFDYEVWQVREEYLRKYGFRSYKDFGEEFNKDFYYKSYVGEYDLSDIKAGEGAIAFLLGELFEMFNVARPIDFRGHSMTVSDVVVIEGQAYYCDEIGWKRVQF